MTRLKAIAYHYTTVVVADEYSFKVIRLKSADLCAMIMYTHRTQIVKKVLNVLAEMSRQGFSDVSREHAHALIMTG